MTCKVYLKTRKDLKDLEIQQGRSQGGESPETSPAPTVKAGWGEDSKLNNLWNYRNLKPNKLCVPKNVSIMRIYYHQRLQISLESLECFHKILR